MDNKHKHLDMIQSVITRMASNSFLIKGWTITLVSLIFGLSSDKAQISSIPIVLLPVIAFWILDGYYLRQERLFRQLYDKVRQQTEDKIDFSMNTSEFSKKTDPPDPLFPDKKVDSWLRVCFSSTIAWFYFPVLISVGAAVIWIFVNQDTTTQDLSSGT